MIVRLEPSRAAIDAGISRQLYTYPSPLGAPVYRPIPGDLLPVHNAAGLEIWTVVSWVAPVHGVENVGGASVDFFARVGCEPSGGPPPPPPPP